MVSCEKAAEPIDMSFEETDSCRPREALSDEGQGRTNPFAAARGGKTALTAFRQNSLTTCIIHGDAKSGMTAL